MLYSLPPNEDTVLPDILISYLMEVDEIFWQASYGQVQMGIIFNDSKRLIFRDILLHLL